MSHLEKLSLLLHPTLGIFAVLSALWLLVESLNATKNNTKRIRLASYSLVIWMVLTWILAGEWYIENYPVDKALLLKSSWAFAHSIVMEIKEHLFFIPLVLSFYLLIVVYKNRLEENDVAKKMVISISGLIIFLALVIDGAGALISQGVKIAYTTIG
jgi:hypothetical protein